MRYYWLLGLFLIIGIVHAQEVREHPTLKELVIFSEKKIPWDGLDCGDCHFNATKMSDYGRPEFYIDVEKYKKTDHGNKSVGNTTCYDCHLLTLPVYTAKGNEYLNWAGFCPPPKIIGGYGSNDTYHTVPSEGCVNKDKGCHWTKEIFFSSEHFLQDDRIKSEKYWNSSHEDYRPWYCEGCHATCGSCHWDGPEPKEEEEFKFDFLENVEAHKIRRNISSEICAICHHGYYNFTENFPKVSVYGSPQYEELSVSVHSKMECKDCHRNIHGGTYETGAYGKRRGPISCGTCHTDVIKSLEAGPHINVACVSCHSTWLPIWQDPESLTLEPMALSFGRVDEPRSWPTHEIRKKENVRECSYCHGNSTTQQKYLEMKEEAIEKMNKSLNDVIGARAVLVTAVKLKFQDARAAWAHVSSDRDDLTRETLALAKEAKKTADLINFVSFIAYLAIVLAIIGLILVIWPYD
jgi:hypothetical protein